MIEYFYNERTKLYTHNAECEIDPISNLPIRSSNGTLKQPKGDNLLWSIPKNEWIDALELIRLNTTHEVNNLINNVRREITKLATPEKLSGWNLKALSVSGDPVKSEVHLTTESALRNIAETSSELKVKISQKSEALLQAVSILDGLEYSYLDKISEAGSTSSLMSLYEELTIKLKQSF